MTQYEDDCLDWSNRVAKAYENLTWQERSSLSVWRKAGLPFSSWPGWRFIVGDRPIEQFHKAA